MVDDFHADEASVAGGLVGKSVCGADFLRGVVGVKLRAVGGHTCLRFTKLAATTIGVLTTRWCALAL